MVMRSLGLILTSMVLAACPGASPADDDVDPDGPPAGIDVPPGTSSIKIRVKTDHEIPATIQSGDVRIDLIEIAVASLGAVGDAAPSGDPRTTTGALELQWDDNEAPGQITFDQAPTGRYSQIKIHVAKPDDDGKNAFEIKGAVRVGGDFEPFEIDCEDLSFVASIMIERRLDTGETAEIELELDTDLVFDGVDLAAAPRDEGVHTIDDDSPAMAGIVARMMTGIKPSGTSADLRLVRGSRLASGSDQRR